VITGLCLTVLMMTKFWPESAPARGCVAHWSPIRSMAARIER